MTIKLLVDQIVSNKKLTPNEQEAINTTFKTNGRLSDSEKVEIDRLYKFIREGFITVH